MKLIKKFIHAIGLFIAALMSMYAPIEITHGSDNCCANCEFKKEEEVELCEKEEYRDEC